MNETKTEINWRKLPSVWRERKYFYTGLLVGQRYWIVEVFPNRWIIKDFNGALPGSYRSADEAKRAVCSLGIHQVSRGVTC